MSIATILLIVAGILAIVELFRSQAQSLVAWAVVCIVEALLL